jgi:hypothetical protein
VTVSYPAGLQEDYIVRIPLERNGAKIRIAFAEDGAE